MRASTSDAEQTRRESLSQLERGRRIVVSKRSSLTNAGERRVAGCLGRFSELPDVLMSTFALRASVDNLRVACQP